jgi:Domain of unknown function (DUF4157)
MPQSKEEKLPDCAKNYLKQYFPNLNLDNVVIHTDGLPRIVQIFNTVPGGVGAFTFSNHIYFPRDGYHPETVQGFASLGHEVAHVDQFRKLGIYGFVNQYIKDYLNHIDKQLPEGPPFLLLPLLNPFTLDTFAIKFKEWLDASRAKYPSIDFNKVLNDAYRNISLEVEAYNFGAKLLAELEKQSSPCMKAK